MQHLQQPARAAFWGGLGAALSILLIQAIARHVHAPLLIAPFGASCVVLFLSPGSELARPRNLLGGYLVGSLTGFALLMLLPGSWWAAAPAVGLTVALMRLTHTVHPPAAAQPLVILLAQPSWHFILLPTLPGVVLLLLASWAFHRGLLPLARSAKSVAG